MNIHDLFGELDYRAHVNNGLVSIQRHPNCALAVLNYTAQAQYARHWDAVTLQSRGLIFDTSTLEVVARAFPKFFNYGEVPLREIPQNAPLVMEKMDGSLGIVYNGPEGPAVATRGSFTSDQAQWATEWLRANPEVLGDFTGYTPLVEIIYPANRIVVDYGDRAELVLLGALEIETGADLPIWEIDFWHGPKARLFPNISSAEKAWSAVNEHDMDTEEGFVLVWYKGDRPSFRLKMKNSEYVRLHRLLTNVSTRTIWSLLKDGGDVSEILDNVPDEFYDWVKATITELEDARQEIIQQCSADIQHIESRDFSSRKEMAEVVKQMRYPHLVFAAIDGKPVSEAVWKMVEPEFQKPFVNSGALDG